MNVEYRDDAEISVAAAIDLYKRSTLGERRPVDRPDIFAGMLENASLTVSAWHEGRLVGVARSLTDFTYVAYLADLAVDAAYQRQGIGVELIARSATQASMPRPFSRTSWWSCVSPVAKPASDSAR